MKRVVLAGVAAGIIAGFTGMARSQEPPRVINLWEVGGMFREPAAAAWDQKRGRLYVSNMNGPETAKDGNGFISTVKPNGNVDKTVWVQGLDSPRGVAVSGDRLFVADIDTLVVIDIETAGIIKRLPVPGAIDLTGVDAGPDGTVWGCDPAAGRIYRLKDASAAAGQMIPWLTSSALKGADGITAAGNELVVACGGKKGSGRVFFLSVLEARILRAGKPMEPISGLAADPASSVWYTSGVQSGNFIRIETGGAWETLGSFVPGAGDGCFIPARKAVVFPYAAQNRLTAIRIVPEEKAGIRKSMPRIPDKPL